MTKEHGGRPSVDVSLLSNRSATALVDPVADAMSSTRDIPSRSEWSDHAGHDFLEVQLSSFSVGDSLLQAMGTNIKA